MFTGLKQRRSRSLEKIIFFKSCAFFSIVLHFKLQYSSKLKKKWISTKIGFYYFHDYSSKEIIKERQNRRMKDMGSNLFLYSVEATLTQVDLSLLTNIDCNFIIAARKTTPVSSV